MYAVDFCMCIRTAYKSHIRLSRQNNIIGILTLTCNEPFIFNPFNGLPDQSIGSAHTTASSLVNWAWCIASAACLIDLIILW